MKSLSLILLSMLMVSTSFASEDLEENEAYSSTSPLTAEEASEAEYLGKFFTALGTCSASSLVTILTVVGDTVPLTGFGSDLIDGMAGLTETEHNNNKALVETYGEFSNGSTEGAMYGTRNVAGGAGSFIMDLALGALDALDGKIDDCKGVKGACEDKRATYFADVRLAYYESMSVSENLMGEGSLCDESGDYVDNSEMSFWSAVWGYFFG